MSTADQDEEDRSGEQALRNPLVLQYIFKFLPTGFLLSSCSLVNKSWNIETRTFIRDYRKCTVGITEKTDGTFCQFLKHLDELCGQITENGRTVPFNSFHFNLTSGKRRRCTLDCSDDEELAIPNLRSQMKLFHLDIDLRSSWYQCHVHKPLFVLLQIKSNQLQSLKIERAGLLEEAVGTADWDPDFCHLQFINISNATRDEEDLPSVQKLGLIRNILEAAPNLKSIAAQDLGVLQMVPEDKYRVLEEIEFKFGQPQDLTLYEKILEVKPRLKTIRIFPSDGPNYNNSDRDRQHRFDATLEKLLEICHQSLGTLSIVGAYEGFGRLCHPPLVNVTKFKMDGVYELRRLSTFYNTLLAIDYANKMPRLQSVEFEAPPMGFGYPYAEIRSCCTTVRNFTLTIDSGPPNLLFFEAIFPNVSTLKITCTLLAGCVPYSRIWDNWPRLEELEISDEGMGMVLSKNYDDEFCGIHPEEAELLREKDEEYLKAVNIVPEKHGILTMKSKGKANDLQFHSLIWYYKLIIKFTF